MQSVADVVKGIADSQVRAIARGISWIENGHPHARELLQNIYPTAGKARVVGFTGSPGAGKSTLVDSVAVAYRKRGLRVAILAVDPTSPFTGGAILGDRIRMNQTTEDADVFVRSMATRGSLGGLARATFDAVTVLDAAGFDIILIETVGVGQVEVDVVRMVDTCVVVLVPGMGDSVQAFKAGILEIADVFAINKADKDGADLLHRDIRLLISMDERADGDWETPIVRTVATKLEGISELCDQIEAHGSWLQHSAEGTTRRRTIAKESIVRIFSDMVMRELLTRHAGGVEQMAEACYRRQVDPYTAATTLLAEWLQAQASLAAKP
jgi:LAO/AO transport system kinase